jgi:hypothetical protein
MSGKCHRWLAPACILAALSAGCVAPPIFTVETVVHPDGSCDRTIIQPKHDALPAEALKPEWNARWKSVKELNGPPGSPPSASAGSDESQKYITARGSFRSPRDIPPHYRSVDDEFPAAGASELRRTYARSDYGFVVEHRWSETVTDIVTLPGYLEARDKLLDILLPMALRFIEEEFGPGYDLSGLSTFVRRDVRRALEEASLLLYDAGARRRLSRGEQTIDPELAGKLVALSRRLGFDPLDANGKLVADQEAIRRRDEFCRRVILDHVRHRDGSPVDRSEADAVIARALADPKFFKTDPRQNERLKRFAGPLVVRMMGLHGFPLGLLFRWRPRFDFALQLPGELVESNGTVFRNGRTRWKFAAEEIFPDGYEMKARSLVIDRDGQKKALGRVAIDDEEEALEFVELVGNDAQLLAAVRKLKESGDRGALDERNFQSSERIERAKRLREMLLGP